MTPSALRLQNAHLCENSIGYTYKINKITKAFVHYSILNKEDSADDITFVSIGFEYKF